MLYTGADSVPSRKLVPEAVISQVVTGHSAKVNKLEPDGRGPRAGQWTMQLAPSGHCWSASLLSRHR